jgi:hypothetical protein
MYFKEMFPTLLYQFWPNRAVQAEYLKLWSEETLGMTCGVDKDFASNSRLLKPYVKQLHSLLPLQVEEEEDDEEEFDKFNYDVGLEYGWSVPTVQVCNHHCKSQSLWYWTNSLTCKSCTMLVVVKQTEPSTNLTTSSWISPLVCMALKAARRLPTVLLKWQRDE